MKLWNEFLIQYVYHGKFHYITHIICVTGIWCSTGDSILPEYNLAPEICYLICVLRNYKLLIKKTVQHQVHQSYHSALVFSWPESIWSSCIIRFREQLWMLSKETIYIYNVWNTDNKTLSKFRDMYYNSILLWCIHSWAYWIILGPYTWERTLSAIVNSDGIHWFTSTICLATVLSIYAYLTV